MSNQMMDMLKRPKLEGPFDQVYAKDNSEPMTQAEKEKKMEEINPKGIYVLSYLMEPFFRSATFIHSWILFFIIKLTKARFSFVRLAKGSVLALFIDVDTLRESHLLLMYFAVFSVGLTCILLFVNFFLSRGKTLPRLALKKIDLKGKVAIVTGGYSGIGYETVLQLLKWNCKVVICGRNKTKATNAIEKLKSTNSFDPYHVSFIEMDLDDLVSVKKASEVFLKNFDRLDFLINNAGLYVGGCETTKLDFERNFSANFLGHFCLTQFLLETIKKSKGRIVNVSSMAHYHYDPNMDKILETKSTTSLDMSEGSHYYGRSKFFMIWLSRTLQRKMREEKQMVLCFSMSPGLVKTPLTWPMKGNSLCLLPRFMAPLIMKRPVDGAATILYLCTAPPWQLVPGAYYSDCNLGLVSRHVNDKEREDKLFNIAQEMVDNVLK
ncbi:hypothetical protein MACJ_003070 [Theileria orientalis]|uniref:Uncharacterized protein n=1 Tax=Theileria orientalis TaxID=68886 RepID=A0A976M720_THEOR|nr:hypothetical protein MACJ_003070 [Theileria orientalis]